MHAAYSRKCHDKVVKTFVVSFVMVELVVIHLYHKGDSKYHVDDKVYYKHKG